VADVVADLSAKDATETVKMTGRFTVTALGSCRIVNPMRLASSAGLVALNNTDVYGYVHTPDEVIQLLDYIDGMDLPDEIVPYLAGSRTVQRRAACGQPDIYLIEIASLNTIRFHNWLFQLNYFAERLRPHPDIYCTYLEAPGEEQRDRRAVALARSSSFATLPKGDRRILVDAYSNRLTREDVRGGVLAILERVQSPVLFVTHIDIADAGGKSIEARRQIIRWLTELADELGVSVFDPTSHVLRYGIATALADGGQSRTHYSEKFEWLLANLLVEEMSRVISRFPRPGHSRAVVSKPRQADFQLNCKNARDEALKLIRAGDLSGASALARAAIADSPPCPRAMSILAQAALRGGDPSSALDFALKTSEAEAHETSAIVVAAKALTKLHRYDLAAEKWEQMSTHRPGSVWPLVEAARCRLRAKSPEAALDLVATSLRHEPGDVLSLAIQAEALYMLRRWSELVDIGVLLAPKGANAALAILQSMVAANEMQGISRIANAIRGSPTRCNVPQELSDALRQSADQALANENWRAAGECWRTLLAFDAGDAAASKSLAEFLQSWIEKANRLAKSGALEDAAAAYDAALAVDPHHSAALRQAAMLAEKQSAWEQAAELWIRYSDNETDPASLIRTAKAAELAGREEEALTFYQRTLALDPGHAKAAAAQKSLARRLGKKGRKLESEGDALAAAKVASAVLQVDPEDAVCSKILRRQSSHVAAQLRQARIAGDITRQEALAHELLRLDPNRFEALKVLSAAHMKSGHFLDAVELLRRIVSVQPDQAAHWIKLSRCLRILKRFDEAEAAAREALARDPGNGAAQKTLADLELRGRAVSHADDLRGRPEPPEMSGHGHKERLSTQSG